MDKLNTVVVALADKNIEAVRLLYLQAKEVMRLLD